MRVGTVTRLRVPVLDEESGSVVGRRTGVRGDRRSAGSASCMSTVVITGASSGIGRATARRFAAPGVRLALIARDREGLDAAAAEVERAGAEALTLPVDVSDADAVDAAAESTEAALGEIDIWV